MVGMVTKMSVMASAVYVPIATTVTTNAVMMNMKLGVTRS